MICTSCDCGCLILPYSCLYEKNSNLKRLEIEQRPELLNAVNAFVLVGDLTTGGLLGEKCFNELCANIKAAEALANAYRKDNPTARDERTAFWFHLEPRWNALLKNGYFQSMYAAYVLYYYYYLKIASSETTLDGDVKHNRAGTANDGEASQNIDLTETNAKTTVHLNLAQRYATMFKTLFFERHLKDYPCFNICGCNDNLNCGIPDKDGFPKVKPKPRKPRSTYL